MNQYRLPAFAALSSLPSICLASGPGQAELLGLFFFGSIAFSAETHLLSLGVFLPLLRRGALQRTSYAYLIPVFGMTSLYIISGRSSKSFGPRKLKLYIAVVWLLWLGLTLLQVFYGPKA